MALPWGALLRRGGRPFSSLRDLSRRIRNRAPRLEDNVSLAFLLKKPWETRVLNPQSKALSQFMLLGFVNVLSLGSVQNTFSLIIEMPLNLNSL